MKFCARHWAAMRKAVDDRGLTPLVAAGGEKAARKMESELHERTQTRENFDPLMSMHWAIAGNAMDMLGRAGINPLYLLAADDRSAPPGRSTCPLCELNYLHKTSCTDARCVLDKEHGYDWMIDRAADDVLTTARELQLAPPPA